MFYVGRSARRPTLRKHWCNVLRRAGLRARLGFGMVGRGADPTPEGFSFYASWYLCFSFLRVTFSIFFFASSRHSSYISSPRHRVPVSSRHLSLIRSPCLRVVASHFVYFSPRHRVSASSCPISCIGHSTRTVVPFPGAEAIEKRPPESSALSRMLVRPNPFFSPRFKRISSRLNP